MKHKSKQNFRFVNKKREIVRVVSGNRHIVTPSFKEKEIIKFLKEEHVKYVREYPVNITVNKKELTLYFDFYLPDYNILIEYDGKHHSQPIYGAERLAKTKKHDSYKNMWAIRNKKPLLRLNASSSIGMDICAFLDKLYPIDCNPIGK